MEFRTVRFVARFSSLRFEGAFILRRLAQAIPTLIGVLLLTFLLFNIVGGSPAALTLGERASPRALEEFDEVRGFNKPLVAGRWSPTRLYPDGPPRWTAEDGAPAPTSDPELGSVRLGPGDYRLAAAFPPLPGVVYRLELVWRPQGDATAAVSVGGVFQGLETQGLSSSKPWKTAAVLFAGRTDSADAADSEKLPPRLRVTNGEIEILSARVRRRNRHAFDSQFFHHLGRLLCFDLGVSSRENRRVAELLREGIGPSLALTVPIFFVGLATALALALVCAYRRNSWLDRSAVVLSVGLMSVNYLVWITAGQYVLAYRLGWFPAWGYESFRHLALPALIGIISGLGADVRFYRTLALDEIGRDYVRTAFARGAGAGRVLFRHVLPNLMLPVLTNVALALPFLYTGSLLLESFFGIPGLGYLSVNAIHSADVDVLRAVVWIGALLYMAANLLTDLAYAALDPRVRLR